MTIAAQAVPGDELVRSGDDAGTALGDRQFRPDIQGLRAVAVLLVVLYHAGLRGLSGGYVGVDVFFVISGFVITGLLLRERGTSGRTSLISFYGRRSKRIIPAATLVIVVTVVMAYARVGVVFGNQAATDARWTAVFLANFHFASIGTNYLTAQLPPSPLQNFWSLAVEEQFYLVYPTVFLLVAAIRTRVSLQARLSLCLVAVVFISFVLSVVQTTVSPTVAYFSPFTRAWELALGALVAVSTQWLLAVPKAVGAALTWLGLAGIAYGAIEFTSATAYPGYLVAIPVMGTALVIAGGTRAPRRAAESLLKRGPFQWFGKLSYSLYLWHWPLLVIAADAAGTTSLPFHRNVTCLVLALIASVVSFYLIENPVRHARFSRSGRWTPIGLGAVLIALSLLVATMEIDIHMAPMSSAPAQTSGSKDAGTTVAATTADVEQAIRASTTIKKLPTDLTPALSDVRSSWGGPPGQCWPAVGQTSIPPCMFGDPSGTRTMVVYGDSHAGMWFQTLNSIAKSIGWRLAYLGKPWCPASSLPYPNPSGNGEYSACDQWHRFALARINHLHPDLVIITQDFQSRPDGGGLYSGTQWQEGLAKTISKIHVVRNKIVVLGNMPLLPFDAAECLSHNVDDVQACSSRTLSFGALYIAEKMAAAEEGVHYVNVTRWFCSNTCPAVIGKYEVYFDQEHITEAYASFLAGVLARSLPLDFPKAFFGPPTTSVVVPTGGTIPQGRLLLDATASSNATSVRFELTGGRLHHHVIAGSELGLIGWADYWNSTSVPKGTYTLQSVATNFGNVSATSVGVTIHLS